MPHRPAAVVDLIFGNLWSQGGQTHKESKLCCPDISKGIFHSNDILPQQPWHLEHKTRGFSFSLYKLTFPTTHWAKVLVNKTCLKSAKTLKLAFPSELGPGVSLVYFLNLFSAPDQFHCDLTCAHVTTENELT